MIKKALYNFLIIYKEWDSLIHAIPFSATLMKKLIIKKNRYAILNRSKDYYKNDKKRLREQARDKYGNLSEEQKNKKREYGRKRYHHV